MTQAKRSADREPDSDTVLLVSPREIMALLQGSLLCKSFATSYVRCENIFRTFFLTTVLFI